MAGSSGSGPFPAPAQAVYFDLRERAERVLGPGEQVPERDEEGFLWVDVELPAPEAIAALARAGLVPSGLLQEDSAPGSVEAHPEADHLHLALVGARLGAGVLLLDRRHLVISDGTVVSAHRQVPTHFSTLRARYRDDFARYARSHGFLIFQICSQLADDLHTAVRDIGDRIDALRVLGLRSPDAIDAETGADLLSSVLLIRRILARTRDVLVELSARRSPFVPESTQPYLRDIAHRLDGQLSDLAFSRDVLSGALAEGPRRDADRSSGPAPRERGGGRAPIGREPLQFIGLGGFDVRRGEQPVPYSAFEGNSARSLLAALLCAGGPVGREDLVHWLWPELDRGHGETALEKAVRSLRRVLEPEAPREGTAGRLVEEAGALSLVMGAEDSWDVEDFLGRAREAAAAVDVSQRIALHESALALHRGPLYPEWPFADWSREQRGRCEEAHRALRAGLAEALMRAGRADEAVFLFEELLEAEPECEAWHRGLMRAHAEAGHRSVALRQFHACRSILRQTRGAEPEPETQALYLELLRR